jgi:hypothetical protein
VFHVLCFSKNGARNKRDFYIHLLSWVWENMIPIALIHEQDSEGAFNGLAKIRAMIRRKAPLRRVLNFLMNSVLVNKLKKKSRGSRYNECATKPWVNVEVCIACRMEEDDEVSALTLLQVCFGQPCLGCYCIVMLCHQSMVWIASMLHNGETEDIDDLFIFYDSGHVVSRCATAESDEPEIFIQHADCQHEIDSEFSDETTFEVWLEDQCEAFDEKSRAWSCDLREEVFFRALEKIPGGQALIERGERIPSCDITEYL